MPTYLYNKRRTTWRVKHEQRRQRWNSTINSATIYQQDTGHQITYAVLNGVSFRLGMYLKTYFKDLRLIVLFEGPIFYIFYNKRQMINLTYFRITFWYLNFYNIITSRNHGHWRMFAIETNGRVACLADVYAYIHCNIQRAAMPQHQQCR